MWTIKIQIERRGKSEVPVKVKHVRMFPKKDKRTKEVIGFGRLGFMVLSMLIGRKKDVYRLTWSGYSGHPGTWKFTRPSKWEHDVERDLESKKPILFKGRTIPDYLSPKVEIKGEADRFESPEQLAEFLDRLMGQEMTARIVGLFSARMQDIADKKAARLAEQEELALAA